MNFEKKKNINPKKGCYLKLKINHTSSFKNREMKNFYIEVISQVYKDMLHVTVIGVMSHIICLRKISGCDI